MQQNEYP